MKIIAKLQKEVKRGFTQKLVLSGRNVAGKKFRDFEALFGSKLIVRLSLGKPTPFKWDKYYQIEIKEVKINKEDLI